MSENVPVNTSLTAKEINELKKTIRHQEAAAMEALDWTKSNVELAQETGIHFATIRTWRFKLGKHLIRQTKYWPACKQWDWSLSNTAIARKYQVPVKTAQDYRALLDKAEPPRDYQHRPEKRRLRRPLEIYKDLDWHNKADVELARETGLSRERMRQLRAQLGLPRRPKWELDYERFKRTFEGVQAMTFAQCKEKFHCCDKTFVDFALRAGIKVVRAKKPCVHPWEKMDWRLPNFLLGKIWGLKPHLVATRRCNFCLPSPEFVYLMGNYPEEWTEAVEAEKQKAADHILLTRGHNDRTVPQPVYGKIESVRPTAGMDAPGGGCAESLPPR